MRDLDLERAGSRPHMEAFSTTKSKFDCDYLLTLILCFSHSDLKTWKDKFNKAEFVPKKDKKQVKKSDGLIQWAGGLHKRHDFNKRKDNLAEWTEVLFSH